MSRSAPLIAIDTETTGLNHRRGARPFAIATCTADGTTTFYEWAVDPFSRQVKYDKKGYAYIRKIHKHLANSRCVFHNAKFDIRMLSLIPGMSRLSDRSEVWRTYEDTALAAHVVNAADIPHRLKDLAIKYLEILDDDEQTLRDRVKSIRINEAKHRGWAIGEEIEMDYWMPGTLARLHPREAEPGDADLLREYNIQDVRRTMLLHLMYEGVLEQDNLQAPYRREKKLQKVVFRMGEHGVSLVKRRLDAELKRYSTEAHTYERKCVELLTDKYNWPEDVNLNSSKQLQRVLFTDPVKRRRNDEPEQTYGFGLAPTKVTSFDKKTEVPNFSTDKWEIPKLHEQAVKSKNKPAAQFIDDLRHFRKNDKAVGDLNGYLALAHCTQHPTTLTNYWRLFPDLKQTGTTTTRFSHSNPNTANVSKGDKLDKDDEETDFTLREVFGPTKGRVWYAFDYNQLQLRIFAKVAQEWEFVKALRAGYDAHTWVATQIYECSPDEVSKLMRRVAKNVNFGFIFGAGERKIDITSGIKGLSSKIRKLFPAAHDFMQRTIRHVKQYGHITTLGGYRLPVARNFAYAGVCYIVQGSEGDIVKNAMIEVDEHLRRRTNDEAFMSLQVHDELVFDFPRDPHCHTARGCPRDHRVLLRDIAQIMVKAGAELGVETPVACERIPVDWAHGVEQKLGRPIKIQRYVNVGGKPPKRIRKRRPRTFKI